MDEEYVEEITGYEQDEPGTEWSSYAEYLISDAWKAKRWEALGRDLNGGVSPNRRKFRHPNSNPATIVSRLIICSRLAWAENLGSAVSVYYTMTTGFSVQYLCR